MFSNFWIFRLQKKQLARHYSDDRAKLFQAGVLSNIFLGCAAVILLFSVGVKLVFPDLMDPVSRRIFLGVDLSLSSMCFVAYGFLQAGFFKTGREIFTISAFTATIVSIMLTGGYPNSMVLPCLIIPPVIAYLVYGGRVGFALAITVFTIIHAQWFASAFLGLNLPDLTSKASESINQMIVFSTTYGAVVAMVAIYQNRNQQLQKELTEERMNLSLLANQDALTGIGNSRKFYEDLELLGQMALEENCSFAIMTIDLDDFKQINDTYGHQTGDKVLIATANRIKNCIRVGDVVARIGGDEFAILLRSTVNIDLVDKTRIRLRKIALEPIVVDGIDHFIGMSIGHSLFPEYTLDTNLLLRQSDKSMYEDKTRKSKRKQTPGDVKPRPDKLRNSRKAA